MDQWQKIESSSRDRKEIVINLVCVCFAIEPNIMQRA